MGKKFNAYVSVYSDPASYTTFAPGDDVPEWAENLVGDHVFEGFEDDSVDVRLTDPENEPDDETFFTPNTLPPSIDTPAQDVDEEEVDLSKLNKAELIELAEDRGLDSSGTKAELIERILDDQEEDETDEDDE